MVGSVRVVLTTRGVTRDGQRSFLLRCTGISAFAPIPRGSRTCRRSPTRSPTRSHRRRPHPVRSTDRSATGDGVRGVDTVRADGPRGESPAEIRHRTLTESRRVVQQHPAVDGAAGARGGGGGFANSRSRSIHSSSESTPSEPDRASSGDIDQTRPRRRTGGFTFTIRRPGRRPAWRAELTDAAATRCESACGAF